jgi:hypothetical protein
MLSSCVYLCDIKLLKREHMEQSSYVGMWVTADGLIRQELLPDGRYDEARGARKVPILDAIKLLMITFIIG